MFTAAWNCVPRLAKLVSDPLDSPSFHPEGIPFGNLGYLDLSRKDWSPDPFHPAEVKWGDLAVSSGCVSGNCPGFFGTQKGHD